MFLPERDTITRGIALAEVMRYTNSISIEHFVGRDSSRHNQRRVKTRPTDYFPFEVEMELMLDLVIPVHRLEKRALKNSLTLGIYPWDLSQAAPDGILDMMHVTAQGIVAGANMVLVDFHPAPPKRWWTARKPCC
jgi:hypothetical protein